MSEHKTINTGIDDELERQKYESDKAFVEQQYDKANIALEKAERSYQLSGGYGSRSNIVHYQNQLKLCGLALKGLESTCQTCRHRRSNANRFLDDLKQCQEELDIDRIPVKQVIGMIEALM
jgi:hypothetical protein